MATGYALPPPSTLEIHDPQAAGKWRKFKLNVPYQILRDRLVFGVRDPKVRERLLREAKLTLAKTDEICHAAESMLTQLRIAVEE